MLDILIYFQIAFVKLLFPKYWLIPVRVLYSQAWHETGGFTSPIFKEHNNLFGMKHPKKRKSTSTGTAKGHAVFSSQLSSIYDYFLRQSYFNIKFDYPRQYMVDTVNSGYAEDEIYLSKWINLYERKDKKILIAVALMFVFTLFLIDRLLKKWLNIDLLKIIKVKIFRRKY